MGVHTHGYVYTYPCKMMCVCMCVHTYANLYAHVFVCVCLRVCLFFLSAPMLFSLSASLCHVALSPHLSHASISGVSSNKITRVQC